MPLDAHDVLGSGPPSNPEFSVQGCLHGWCSSIFPAVASAIHYVYLHTCMLREALGGQHTGREADTYVL